MSAASRATAGVQTIAAVLLAGTTLAPVPAHADLLLTATTVGEDLGLETGAETVTAFKGLKLRSDVSIRGTQLSTIIDLDRGEFIAIDHAARSAVVYDLESAPTDPARRAMGQADIEISLEPTGREKQIAGETCVEHQAMVRVPANASAGERLIVILQGPVWLSSGEPETDDWSRFYTAASDRGFLAMDPRVVQVDPARTRGMMALYRRMANDGFPCASRIEVGVDGSGDLAARMSRMGSSSVSIEMTSVSTAPLADERFMVPAGYVTSRK